MSRKMGSRRSLPRAKSCLYAGNRASLHLDIGSVGYIMMYITAWRITSTGEVLGNTHTAKSQNAECTDRGGSSSRLHN